MKLNLITLAIVFATTPVMAADFSLTKANTSKVNVNTWKCKGCTDPSMLSGDVAVGIGYSNIDDVHAANVLGQEDTGTFAAVNGRLSVNSNSGWRVETNANNLGMKNGDAGIKVTKDDLKLYANYDQLNYLKSDKTLTPYYFSQDQLISATPYSPVLGVERNRFTLGADAQTDMLGLALNGDLSFRSEEKLGHKRVSVATPSPINLAQPIDSRTNELLASSSLSGDNWLAAISYLGSVYNNHAQEIYHETYGSLLAPDPDNEAHQLTLSGNIRGQQSVFDARVSAGRMIQDSSLVNAQISPIQSWDGQINTLDVDANYMLMASDRLRIQLAGRYSDRDNKSSSFEFPQYDFNAKTGILFNNLALDTKSTRGSAKFQYRLAKDYRIDAGYQFDRKERNYSDRETTDEHQLWAKVKMTGLELWKIELKGGVSRRDGSRYLANEFTNVEENPLLRKYYLADRDRVEAEMRLFHQPLPSLSVVMNLRFANDDYTNTKIGLTDDRNYSYQLSVNYLVNKQLSLYSFVSQEWIDANQSGAQWKAEINDRFVSLGGGFEYQGLLQNKLILGGDYLFANSNSDSDNAAITDQQGDDYQYNHSVGVYAKYRLSDASQLRVDYRYERYYDTDYANVAVDAVNGLITLGELDHNYNAHQLMLSYSISL
ncbi:MtrB/PioB family decaheme-associated outer membrane protein [Shewanella dokdonensis]|uniref:MtrB/PioB family decaheme-associated outer membrane protein n=1 Tax=Shewanella dokdonensis TaxID=712036 RepID=UPI00200CCB73|nr:MtrB/PioB family decaheme-associated outer membrane protein [Shewanella dokdonensis]MCL1075780.1 MtrB/PioB family decaheme-associated outer membrane protein [Shewanella dokdonensis]